MNALITIVCSAASRWEIENISLSRQFWLDGENDYCVVSDIEDLTTMSLEDIESAITGYYDDIEAMEKSYDLPLGQLDSVIAECNFEGRPFCDWEHQSEVVTWNRAEEIIQKFIDTNGEVFEEE